MKQYLGEFLRRGLTAWGFGPVVLAILYLLLRHQGVVEVLTVREVCLGIFSLSTLAFIAGGMNVLYQIEQLPLMAAVSIHGGVLYISYLATYLVNGWLDWGAAPILVFSGIFALGYLAIWAVIYAVMRCRTARINRILMEKHRPSDKAN